MKNFTHAFYTTSSSQLAILISGGFTAVAYLLLVIQQSTFAWLLIGLAVASAVIVNDKRARSYLLLIIAAISIMMFTPVSTSTDPTRMAPMFLGMFLAIAIPYIVSHKIFKHPLIHFALDIKKPLTRRQILLIVFAVVGACPWVLLYFLGTDASSHWPLSNSTDTAIVFGSIILIGLWEEFFFIATISGVLSRILPIGWANILQAIMFTAFLYQIGFVGWIAINCFFYALYQGYVFHSTRRLLVSVIIHVIVDLIVFGALILAVIYR